ncbi:protein BCCIP homolog [Artemia franciscana]|uniref:protein BCCIP homolog n=1 Tax=Artemia franciscana TaxID=6661 RepID=UPI0032DBD703
MGLTSRKKQKAQSNSKNNETSEESSDSEMECETLNENMVVPVEFEGRNIEGEDFHSVKKLLNQLFLKAQIDLSNLTDIIISQNYIGSALKQVVPEDELSDNDEDDDDEMDVFGVTTIVNLSQRKDKKSIEQLLNFAVLKSGENPSTKKIFEELLSNPSTSLGFLINERFINLPPQISVPLFESLRKEVEVASKKVERKRFSEFSHVIMISKIHKPIDSKKLQKKKAKKQDIPELLWTNYEEEIFFEEALFSFDYSVKHEADTGLGGSWSESDEEWEPFRRVFVFPFDRFSSIVDRLKEEIQ